MSRRAGVQTAKKLKVKARVRTARSREQQVQQLQREGMQGGIRVHAFAQRNRHSENFYIYTHSQQQQIHYTLGALFCKVSFHPLPLVVATVTLARGQYIRLIVTGLSL